MTNPEQDDPLPDAEAQVLLSLVTNVFGRDTFGDGLTLGVGTDIEATINRPLADNV